MTAIAYRKPFMACDSLWSVNDMAAVSRTKIRRLKGGILYGSAGDNDDRGLLALIEKVKKPEDLPSMNQLADLKQCISAMIVFPGSRIFLLDMIPEQADNEDPSERGITEITYPFWAIGSGGDVALGAMLKNASAREAVQAACTVRLDCRGPIHSIRLEDKKSGRKSK